jgi:hypothetical protein
MHTPLILTGPLYIQMEGHSTTNYTAVWGCNKSFPSNLSVHRASRESDQSIAKCRCAQGNGIDEEL